MSKNFVNSSPERFTFQAKDAVEILKINPDDENALAQIKMYKKLVDDSVERTTDPAWQKDNMEYDLRSTTWICDKVTEDKIYAQHLYAAMCNRDFIKLDMLPILKDQRWSCSWRHAGGIIADMRKEGDYIDWYCSGIIIDLDHTDFENLSPEKQIAYKELQARVPEGTVTDEIRTDLQKLGWAVLPNDY